MPTYCTIRLYYPPLILPGSPVMLRKNPQSLPGPHKTCPLLQTDTKSLCCLLSYASHHWYDWPAPSQPQTELNSACTSWERLAGRKTTPPTLPPPGIQISAAPHTQHSPRLCRLFTHICCVPLTRQMLPSAVACAPEASSELKQIAFPMLRAVHQLPLPRRLSPSLPSPTPAPFHLADL